MRAAEASERPPNVTASMERTWCTHRIAFYGNVQTKNAGRMIYGISCRRGYTCDVTMLVKGALRRGLKPAASPGAGRSRSRPRRGCGRDRRAGPLGGELRFTFYALFSETILPIARKYMQYMMRDSKNLCIQPASNMNEAACAHEPRRHRACAAGWRGGCGEGTSLFAPFDQ